MNDSIGKWLGDCVGTVIAITNFCLVVGIVAYVL